MTGLFTYSLMNLLSSLFWTREAAFFRAMIVGFQGEATRFHMFIHSNPTLVQTLQAGRD